MAFGIASGVRPDQGIATAIVGGLLVSLLGGSKVQIAGPAGAFVALLYSIAEKYGVANLLIATMMAGVLLFAMGAFRMGTLVRFIPVSIVIGFTTDRKSTRLNSSHSQISYAVFCLKKISCRRRLLQRGS